MAPRRPCMAWFVYKLDRVTCILANNSLNSPSSLSSLSWSAATPEATNTLSIMLRFATFAALLAVACAGYGYGGYGSGYGSGYAMPVYGGSYGGYGGSYGGGVGNYITGAVQSSRSLSYYDVPSSYGSASPVTIDLPSSVQPLNFNMRTRSSPINIQTSHESSPGSYQETSSVDEPHVRVHNVHRPIIQRLNEVIQPYRQIRQQVNPVQENVQTVVARGQQQQAYGGGYGGSSLYGSGYGNQGGYGGQTSSYYKK